MRSVCRHFLPPRLCIQFAVNTYVEAFAMAGGMALLMVTPKKKLRKHYLGYFRFPDSKIPYILGLFKFASLVFFNI